VKLEENYRCTAPILDCANAVIAKNTKRIGKTLRAHKEGELVRVTMLSDDRAEAQAVARSIKAPWGDHAILYRTHAQSRAIEETLRLHGIPYTIIGGLRFYDRAEVKDMLAFCRLAVNPLADMDLLRVANKPTRGMGAKKVGALKTLASRKGTCMYEALKESSDDKASVNLHRILTEIARARHSAVTLLDFYEEVMRLTGYREALVRTAAKSDSPAQREKAQFQLDNVDELSNDISSFSSQHHGASVDDYLEHVALVSSFDKEGGPVVSLMTIHAAKGLEFPHVHLVGFEEGLLPHINSIKIENLKERAAAIEEERRLAYVAITRAKDHLDVTLVRMRAHQGRPDRAEPSRFLDELAQGRYRRLGF
jgi:DNA helicase-2/ATP-dependent DNA helicase PcrA